VWIFQPRGPGERDCRAIRFSPPFGFNLIDVRDVAAVVADCATYLDDRESRILACGDNVPYRTLFIEMNTVAGHHVSVYTIPPAVVRMLPRLRCFGDFGRRFYLRDHYIHSQELAHRTYGLRDTVADTIEWAAKTRQFRGAFDALRWVVRRYV
jgi:hypothetical protein